MTVTIDFQIEKLHKKIDEISLDTSRDELWNIISDISKSYESSFNESVRRSIGIYYTDLSLAKYMVDEMFDLCFSKTNFCLEKKTLLEPCVGTGNFIFAFLKKIYELGYQKEYVLKILNNIYVADIDIIALTLYKKLLTKFVNIYFGINLEPTYFINRVYNKGLLFNLNNKDFNYIHIKDAFPEIYASGGFDIIITNPPYKNLKAENNKYDDILKYEVDKTIYQNISKFVKNNFSFACDGVLNLYKLFVEEIICKYSKNNAIIGLLIPATILTDKTNEKLRTLILEKHGLKSINILKENNTYLDAQQALCTLLISKSESTNLIRMNKEYYSNCNNNYIFINYNDIKNPYSGNAIFPITNSEYGLLKKLRSYPVIKELPFIINMRGELDLTADKKFITYKSTNYKLIRGKNIGYYQLKNTPITEYVYSDFVEKSSKATYIRQPRIACQQIVNIHKNRRIIFSYIESNNVLGNSCNYICVNSNQYNIDLYALLGIMNSTLINWLFKLTSSNNHVNNYELDTLPIPVESKLIPEISRQVKELLSTSNSALINEIDKLVYKAFGIDKPITLDNITYMDEVVLRYFNDVNSIIGTTNNVFTMQHASAILNDGVKIESIFNNLGLELDKFLYDVIVHLTEKYKKIKQGQVLNHITFKLSDLDLEIVRSVPQGGNWRNIPESIINKSQRLKKISLTGGRTTLYGRIDYNKPSYTITTFFNRPGNGTYIHPEHDRVISVREAARFQSFKDDYYFIGNKGALLKQVGNAVPPLLTYQIGKKIKSRINCETSIDLFCGAGGMTSGFKEAGIKSLLGVDIDRSACLTFKVNNPEINVICEDITKQEVKEKILSLVNGIDIDMVCGGPPCQGFSHAGKRFVDDPRNKLFKDFIEVVSHIKPKIVVMENVEGMLTFLQGKIYNEIIELFFSLGYKTEGRVLLASEYGIPQKRKRVIIICVRNDINIMPGKLFPQKITELENDQITAYEAISDLASIECGDIAFYDKRDFISLSDYAKLMRGLIEYDSFIRSASSKPINDASSPEQLSIFDVL